MMRTVDEVFIKRVYKTSIVVWAFGALVAWSIGGPFAALGWTIGSAISLGLLAGIEWVVRRTVCPGNQKIKKNLTNVSLLHWPIIIAILALAIWLSGRRIPYIIAFVAGLGLVQAVIALKAIGLVIVNHFEEK